MKMNFDSSFVFILSLALFCGTKATPLSPVLLNSPFLYNLVHETTKEFNVQSHKFVSQPQSFVYFDLLEFESALEDGVLYKLKMVLAEVACETTGPPPNTFASCSNLTNRFVKASFNAVYKPWLPRLSVVLTDATEYSDGEIQLPKYTQFLGLSVNDDSRKLFESFKRKHNRLYSGIEDSLRFKIFSSNLVKIKLLNLLDRGSAQYGITQFADLSESEFRRTHSNMKPRVRAGTASILNISDLYGKTMPPKFDWREKGAVSGVKNQGMCGSCWAFAATGNIEGQWFRKTGKLIPLSEQQLLDCDTKDEACNGGLPEWAYDSIVKMGGLMSEEAYPYEAEKENVCHLKRQNISAYITGYANLTSDEKLLATWLAENGPVSVGVNANFLQFYLFGISHPPRALCSKDGLDHAVLLVGYGTSSIMRRPYWIVKNSWGSFWGERGYFRMYRGDGTCGINADPTTSVIH